MNQPIHHRQYSAGLSLIELMVALAVSAIMLLGVTTIYTASKRSYQINSEMAAIQENARYALHTLTNEIRMAGTTGCQNIDSIKMQVLSSPPPAGFSNTTAPGDDGIHRVSTFNLNSYLTGHTYNGGAWSPPFEAGLEPTNFVAGTDAITIRNVSACSARVNSDNGNNLNVTGNCTFNDGDVVIVADCQSADMFTVTGPPGNGNPYTLSYNGAANDPNTLSGKEEKYEGAMVFKANTAVYYLGQDNGVPPTGLYVRRLTNIGGAYIPQQSLLIPNVDDLVITYGLDTDGDPGRSVDTEMFAAAIDAAGLPLIQNAIQRDMDEGRPVKIAVTSPWSRVVRVNLQLLLASEPVGTTLKPFNFDGVNYNDTRSRRVFSTSINIRARTP